MTELKGNHIQGTSTKMPDRSKYFHESASPGQSPHTHSLQIHHCCDKTFTSREAFDEHFSEYHDPKGKHYIAPKNANEVVPKVKESGWGQ